MTDLVADLLEGDHRALARVISRIEDRSAGHREAVARLHRHAGDAHVVGVTGPPGAGKSTLVDELAAAYRDRGATVGVIAIDPASPFSGGAVLGDRIRMAANAGDMDVFFRSMSARGALGGLSTATADAVTALDAFGKDVIVVETVGAGQNEIDVVRTADTVAVLVPPGSGDDVQMLKAGILEIADCFVVNKADLDGADRTVTQLREMLRERGDGAGDAAVDVGTPLEGSARRREGDATGNRSPEPSTDDQGDDPTTEDDDPTTNGDGPTTNGDDPTTNGDDPTTKGDAGRWDPPIVETVANAGEGVGDVIAAFDDHLAHLESSGEREARIRTRHRAQIARLLRADLESVVAEELVSPGGLEAAVDRVLERESDPYSEVDRILGPVERCVRDRGPDEETPDDGANEG